MKSSFADINISDVEADKSNDTSTKSTSQQQRFCISLWSYKIIQNTQAKSNYHNESQEFENPAQFKIKKLFTVEGSKISTVYLQFCNNNHFHQAIY